MPEVKYVEAVHRRFVGVLALRVGGQTIELTGDHPMFVKGDGWVAADTLKAGDLLRTHDNRWAVVDAVDNTGVEREVYNLTVSDHHTFFVGTEAWGFALWVHNTDEYLHAFGPRTQPRAPRPNKDIDVDASGMVHPTDPPTGASTFGKIDNVPLNGHYHTIPEGTTHPKLKITADGSDVGGTHKHAPTHHTISPAESMSFDDFAKAFYELGWTYGGKK